MHPACSSMRAQPILLSSSKRALSSTSTATCFPRSVGLEQGIDHRGVMSHAIEGLFDGEHLRVAGRGVQEIDDRSERVIGMVDQDIFLANGRKDVIGLQHVLELGQEARLVRRVFQLVEFHDCHRAAIILPARGDGFEQIHPRA